MIKVELRSAEFFVRDGHHLFNFEVAGDNGITFIIPVLVANVEGGPNAVHQRAYDNLAELTKMITKIAKDH
ncbi:hypothetical protein [Rhizobium sp. IY2]|uniref:hypothetical protein n=1 Tax=Rhizobium sp. IY2 TaxID=3397853 RepID=UPI0039E09CEC